MNRTPVKSSNIRSVGYDAASETLEVEFTSGSVYAYSGVPTDTWAAMQAEGADPKGSVGKFFTKEIRGSFHGQSVPQEKR